MVVFKNIAILTPSFYVSFPHFKDLEKILETESNDLKAKLLY